MKPQLLKIIKYIKCLSLITIFGSFPAVTKAQSGLYYTPAEVEIWKHRAANGPYRVSGDADINTPGDWTQILSNADAFVSNPAVDRWTNYYDGTGAVPSGTSSAIMSYEPQWKIDRMRDAAFVYLVTGNADYLAPVKSEILWYVNNPALDFTNRTRYPVNGGFIDVNPIFFYMAGVMKVVLAYDYVKDQFTPSERSTIEGWIYNAAEFAQLCLDIRYDQWYSDHDEGLVASGQIERAFRLRDGSNPQASKLNPTHDDGYTAFTLGVWYNNRSAYSAVLCAMAGVLLDEEDFKLRAKRYVKNWIRYNLLPDGTSFEMHRWTTSANTGDEVGLKYVGGNIGQMISIADVLARAGDTSLYDFEVTITDPNHPYPGGPKSLKKAIEAYSKYFNDGWNPARKANGKLIDGIRDQTGAEIQDDVVMSQANIYYRDASITQFYQRNISAGFRKRRTSIVSAGPYHPWSGDFAIFPAKLFLHGGLEHVVWPYGEELMIPVQPLSEAAIGHRYEVQLVAHGGAQPYVWSIDDESALPKGLSLDGATGIISGIASESGKHTFSLKVTDADLDISVQQLELVVLPDDPIDYIARYTFDSAGNWGVDQTDVHHALAVGAPSAETGQINGAVWLNADEDQHLEIADFDYASQGGTVSIWLKLNDNSRWKNQYIFSHGENETQSVGVYIVGDGNRFGEDNLLQTEIRGESDSMSSGSALGIDIGGFVGDGLWHQYILVIDPPESRVYWDGKLLGVAPYGAGGVDPSGLIFVGVTPDGDEIQRYYNGMDDLRLYGRALDEQEIKGLYWAGISRAPWKGNRGWKSISWLGSVYDYHFPWVFHEDHGWQYLVFDGTLDFWSFDFVRGWMWSSQKIYPFMYSFGDSKWKYYDGLHGNGWVSLYDE